MPATAGSIWYTVDQTATSDGSIRRRMRPPRASYTGKITCRLDRFVGAVSCPLTRFGGGYKPPPSHQQPTSFHPGPVEMPLTDLVAPNGIIPALKVNGKKQAIQELAVRAAKIT